MPNGNAVAQEHGPGVIGALLALVLWRRLPWRNLYIIALFLALGFPVVVDLANGFLIQIVHSNFSLGVLYRGLAFLVLSPFVLLLRTYWVKQYIATLMVLFLAGNLIWMAESPYYQLLEEIQIFSKIMYAWALYAFLSHVTFRFAIPIECLMEFVVFFGVVAAASIVFSYFTGLGISTYENTSTFAVKSYFEAQNDIGLAMLLSLVFCMYFFAYRGSWLYGVFALIMMAGLVFLGTRAGLIGGFGSLALFTGVFVLRTIHAPRRSGKRFFLVGIFFTALVGGLILAISAISEYRYLVNKYEDLLEESPREALEIAAHKHLAERSDLAAIVGEGSTAFRVGVLKYYNISGKEGASSFSLDTGKFVEQDILDFVGAYGLIFGGLMLLVVVLLLVKAFIAWSVTRSLLDLTFLTAFALFVIHSFSAGHALISPVVAGPAAVCYLYIIDYALRDAKTRNWLIN